MRDRLPEAGSWIWIRQEAWRVERARRDRSVVRLDVAQGSRTLTFLTPFDRPLVAHPRRAPVRASRQEALARLCGALARTHAWDAPTTARAARVDLLPHQLEPALAIRAGRRRVLIADSVGLGKTVQAGLVLAELLEHTPGLRALLLVPAPLVDQWIHEMQDRFGIAAAPADREGLLAATAAVPFGDSPWSRPGVWIATPDFITQPHVFDTLPIHPWDLLVLDEAHTLVGASSRYAACDELARRARHVLLLTATPHSGDTARYDRLVRLGRHGHDGDGLTIFRRSAADAGRTHGRVVRWHRIAASRGTTRVLAALQQYERLVARRARPECRDQAHLLLALFRKRAVSTLLALDRTLERRQRWLQSGGRSATLNWRQASLDFDDDREVEEDDYGPLTAESGLSAMEERTWMRRLRALTGAARRQDDKLRRLAALIGRIAEPVVIFTEYRDSLDAVAAALKPIEPVVLLHGGLDAPARRAALASFLQGAARILVATDVGGQGLNLHTRARWVINLELPWNPIRLEQRIGRVDRIGQTRRVHATVLMIGHPTESTVLRRLAHRVLIAARAVGDAGAALALPSARTVIAGVLADAPIELPDTPPLVVCRQFARRARAHARCLGRQRALLACWRPTPGGARPRVATRGDLPRGSAAGTAAILLVTATLADATGGVVERHAFIVRMRALDPGAAGRPSAAELVAAAVEARLRSRVRRVRKWLADVRARRLLTERAIGMHLRETCAPDSTQLDLFSRAALRSHDRAHVAIQAEARAAEQVDRASHAAASIGVGAVRIDVEWRTT